ncbi:hypothetical protein BV20DRAFT_1039654 [Pilatotrama ljubarskyi]|nr:hypothetical protein BV20DRAFT_1039654 [Pilatotrama ljubarskyi]
MSSAIVLPNLPNWAEQHIKAIYAAKSAADFDSAFEGFVSKHAKIQVNGKSVSREQYKKLLQGETSSDVSQGINGVVNFDSIVSVPAEGDANTIGTGSVGVSFTAEVFGRFFIFAQRESSTITSSLNIVYVSNPTRRDRRRPAPSSNRPRRCLRRP